MGNEEAGVRKAKRGQENRQQCEASAFSLAWHIQCQPPFSNLRRAVVFLEGIVYVRCTARGIGVNIRRYDHVRSDAKSLGRGLSFRPS